MEGVENEGDVEAVMGFCVSFGGFLLVAVSSLWLVAAGENEKREERREKRERERTQAWVSLFLYSLFFSP